MNFVKSNTVVIILNVNIFNLQKVDYITYLTTFDHLFDIPKERKNAEYRKYLEALLEYLHDYTARVKPLLSVQSEMESVLKDFAVQWEAGAFPGWPVSHCKQTQKMRLKEIK